MKKPLPRLAFLFLGLASLGAAGCNRSQETAASPTPSIQQQGAQRAAAVPQPIQERWDYLNRIRQSEDYDAIRRTLVNDQNQLGVVLAANVTPENAAAVTKKAMEAIAQKFPASDMNLDAYAPTKPLRKVGTAHYNAQTGAVTYTPS
jgi:hypothetical protein